MDFIRELDDEEYGSGGTASGASDAAFARSLGATKHVAPAAVAVRHKALLHRPTTLTPDDFPKRNADDDYDDADGSASSFGGLRIGSGSAAGTTGAVGGAAVSGAVQWQNATLAAQAFAAEQARRSELRAIRAASAVEQREALAEAQERAEESLRRRHERALEESYAHEYEANSNGHEHYFRESERDLVSDAFAAGLGPGSAAVPSAAPLSRSTLRDALAGFKTRDLFASQARRTNLPREDIVHRALHDPVAGGHRPRMARPVSASDFPPTRARAQPIRAGPHLAPQRTIAAEPAHDPARALGVHRLTPSDEEQLVESAVASVSREHLERRAAEQRLKDSVKGAMEQYDRAVQRRNEETARRVEEPYRQMYQHQEADRAAATASASQGTVQKMRPVSAPMARSSFGGGVAVSSAVPRSLRDILSPKERADRSDPRTAISHPDAQILAAQAAAAAAEDEQGDEADAISRPMGFSQRPSTAQQRLRSARYAGAAAAPKAHLHCHGAGDAATRDCSECNSNIEQAVSLAHRHPAGAAALSLYSPAAAATPGASLAATIAPAAPSTLPVPLGPIEAHFPLQAWSLSSRDASEVDALTRELEARQARRERAADLEAEAEDEEQAMLDAMDDAALTATRVMNPALAAATRMRRENRKAEALRRREESREESRKGLKEHRAALRHKTDEWPAERLGIVGLMEHSAADMSLAALKAKQLALGKLGSSLGKTPSHDVAFSTNVVRRKENPPPRGAKPKPVQEEAPPPPPPEPEPVRRGARKSAAAPPPPPPAPPKRAASAKKAPAGSRARPAPVASTLARAQALVGPQSATHTAFVDALLNSSGTRATRDAIAESAAAAPLSRDQVPFSSVSFSAFRDEQSPQARKSKQRPASASTASLHSLAVTGSSATAAAVGGQQQPQRLRPSSAALLGHAVSQPSLLKDAKSRAGHVSALSAHVQGHMSRGEGMRTVEQVKECLAHAISASNSSGALGDTLRESDAREDSAAETQTGGEHGASGPRLGVSRATLERALIAPAVYLSERDARRMLPPQLSNLAEHPFPVVKKKKKKGRKGSSKKKKGGGSSKKKKAGSSAASAAAAAGASIIGLSFPSGQPFPSEHASNPLASDLALISVDDLLVRPEDEISEKADLRKVLLDNALSLAMIFETFSTRSGGGGAAASSAVAPGSGPALMSHLQFWQLLCLCEVFTPPSSSSSSSSSGPVPLSAVSSRAAYSVLLADDDLSVESLDVDELLSRPAWLERLIRIAVLKCGTVTRLPPAPLGEVQPIQPRPPRAAVAFEHFLARFLLPNALTASASDVRMRLVSPPVLQVLQQSHRIALQALFSHAASDRQGSVSIANLRKLVLQEIDVPQPIAVHFERAVALTLPHVPGATAAAAAAASSDASSSDPSLALFYPELLEFFVRLVLLGMSSQSERDLAATLSSFLGRSWESFATNVPTAAATAAAIAASHATAAQHATAAVGQSTPRGVKFASNS